VSSSRGGGGSVGGGCGVRCAGGFFVWRVRLGFGGLFGGLVSGAWGVGGVEKKNSNLTTRKGTHRGNDKKRKEPLQQIPKQINTRKNLKQKNKKKKKKKGEWRVIV